MKIFTTRAVGTNPYENLAYEAALSEFVNRQTLSGDTVVGLYLWQNDNAIIFGRNQNIKAECDYDYAVSNNTRLVRRATGGGAVYHDLGNLCFSIIASDCVYNKDDNFAIVRAALSSLGVESNLSGRNDILSGGFKISGNAYSHYDRVQLHHGTLLVNLDTEFASRVLTPSKAKLAAKGISSVRSRIKNIAEINESISVEMLISCIQREFLGFYNEAEFIEPDIDENYYNDSLAKLSSNSWLDLDGMKLSTTVTGEYGTFKYSLEEKDGCLNKVIYEADIINVELLEFVLDSLSGVQLSEDLLIETYEEAVSKYSFEISEEDKKMMDSIIVSIANNIS